MRVRSRGRRVHARPPPAVPAGHMSLASCPGRGLCLSHARLEPRHFMALTLPPTVTAALNEAAHVQGSGRAGAKCPAQYRLAPPSKAPRCFGAPAASIVSAPCFFFIPRRSEGLHSVSSKDNGVPSVTAARITEHNGGRAAVMPARAKQQEAVVVDSAVMKLARRLTVTLPPWPSQHIFPALHQKERGRFCVLGLDTSGLRWSREAPRPPLKSR